VGFRTLAPMSAADRDLLRRKIAGWVEAEETSSAQRVAHGAPSPARAVEDALELWELRPELFDLPRTELELAEIASAARAWQRLRAHWAA
jgi:hypothetical protein